MLALYFWMFFNGTGPLDARQIIPDSTAIVAGISFVFSAITYLWSPKKAYFWLSFTSYLLIITMTALLVLATGGAHSAFIGLWILAAVFAPIFGWRGIGVITLLLVVYSGSLIFTQPPDIGAIFIALLVTLTPLIIGVLAWSHKYRPRTLNGTGSTDADVSVDSSSIISAIDDGVVAVNTTGQIQLINPAALHMTGWQADDALGLSYKSVLNLTSEEDEPLANEQDPIGRTLRTGKSSTAPALTITTNETGKKFLAYLSISPRGGQDGGAIIVFRDVTSQRAEEKEQAEFISTASHEMRTPVASIEGYLGLALNPTIAQVDDKARDYITKAHESAQHLGRLFQDLLDISRADDGRLPHAPKVVDLVPFVATIIEGLLHQATEKQLVVTYAPMPDFNTAITSTAPLGDRTVSPSYYVNVDNDHLREVVGNLVENAIKYTPKGEVNIDVTGTDATATISIADSGIGIPQEDVPHLFQKFYRVDNSDTREIGGTGLGLYLSRRLIEMMGGKIWVESTYKKGSTFFIELPRIPSGDVEFLKKQQESQHGHAAPAAPDPTPVAPISVAAAQLPPVPAPVSPLPAPAPVVATFPVTPEEPPAPAANTPQAPPSAARRRTITVIERSSNKH